MKLNLAVVIVIFIADGSDPSPGSMPAAILRMAHVDPAIHILQPDARAPAAQLSPQIVTHKSMIVYVQPQVVVDAAGNGRGFNLPHSSLRE
jgi:hypothetical protein